MRKGFLLSPDEREPETRSAPLQGKHGCRSNGCTHVMRREPERRLSAAEHEVFCCKASTLALLAGETSVLKLCRNQEGVVYWRTVYMSAVRECVAMLPLPSPTSLMIAANREPNPFLACWAYYYDLGRPLRQLFFRIWQVASFVSQRWGFAR